METYAKIARLKDESYREVLGVTKKVFDKMLELLVCQFMKDHKNGGSPNQVSVLTRLVIFLEYYREYRTMRNIAFDYMLSKSSVCNYIHWVEETLIKSEVFHLPSRKELYENEELEIAIADATEVAVERPKHGQKKYYSGKKKRHTIKLQIIINALTKAIICINVCSGNVHDFKLLKLSKYKFHGRLKILADSGYQGIKKLHSNSETPIKASKNHKLTPEEKAYNRNLSRQRIVIENVNAVIKSFKILGTRYRNKGTRFKLRASLICGICNLMLS